jgi:hypothetical protein
MDQQPPETLGQPGTQTVTERPALAQTLARTLAETLNSQHDVIARWQAIDCGMTSEALRHRIRPGGPWQRLLPGVYLAVTGVPTVDQRDMAALLHAGPRSVLTGTAALRRHGLRAPTTDFIDVLVPSTRRPQSISFVRVRRSRRMPEQVAQFGPIACTGPARAVVDAALSLTDISEVRAVVADAVQSGQCPLAGLTAEVDHGPVRGSAQLREVLTEVAGGVRSAPGAALRELLERAGVPTPAFGVSLHATDPLHAGGTLIAQTDCWWQHHGIAVQLESREWHLSPDDWERSRARDTRMAEHGIIVLHFTARQISNDPGAVIAAISCALASTASRPPLPVHALPLTAYAGTRATAVSAGRL